MSTAGRLIPLWTDHSSYVPGYTHPTLVCLLGTVTLLGTVAPHAFKACLHPYSTHKHWTKRQFYTDVLATNPALYGMLRVRSGWVFSLCMCRP